MIKGELLFHHNLKLQLLFIMEKRSLDQNAKKFHGMNMLKKEIVIITQLFVKIMDILTKQVRF